MSAVDEFRAEKDAFFRDDPHSPLVPGQRASFDGLSYFRENDALRIRGVLETEGVDRDERIVMETTTGGEQEYRRAGTVPFEVEGVPTQVTLFASQGTDDLFLPFRDATSRKETYGAGRYLEVEPPDPDGRVMVDLYDVSNSFCAYNPEWSCPIPPGENWLQARSAQVRSRSPAPTRSRSSGEAPITPARCRAAPRGSGVIRRRRPLRRSRDRRPRGTRRG